jgi:hypothetical protein
MQKSLAFSLAIILGGAFAVRADDPKKAEDEKLVSAGRLTGVLKNSGSSGGITVDVELILPDPRAQLEQLRHQRDLVLALSIRNPIQRQLYVATVLQQMRASQNAVIRKNVDFDLEPADGMIVRTMVLPDQFDDKGKPKKYTAKDLKELRGPDPNLPGFKADRDSLKNGEVVTVYLMRKKQTAPAKAAPKDKDRKEKDNDKAADEDNKPKIRMIVIRAEPKS